MSTWRYWNLWRNNKIINNVKVWRKLQCLHEACLDIWWNTLSCVFDILLHLSLPRKQLCVFLYVWVLSCFRVRELPRLRQQSSEKSEPARDSGDKRGRGKLSFPPLTIPFLSSSAWPKCSSHSSYSLTWKERVPHTCKKTQSCLRCWLITPNM